MRVQKSFLAFFLMLAVGACSTNGSSESSAKSQADAQAKATKINAAVDETLQRFYAEYPQGRQLANKAEGILVFPKITKGGLVVGGAYGEGALLIDNKIINYYSISSGSIGLQAGYQEHSQIIMFKTPEALTKFRNSSGWEIGADTSVAVVDKGAAGKIDTKTFDQPVVAFVFGQEGLMGSLSLEGSKIQKLNLKS
jgi:lipid-binding SYLF domain-containing protein